MNYLLTIVWADGTPSVLHFFRLDRLNAYVVSEKATQQGKTANYFAYAQNGSQIAYIGRV